MHTCISAYFNTLWYASLIFFLYPYDCYCFFLITFLLWELSFYQLWFEAGSCCSVGIPLAGAMMRVVTSLCLQYHCLLSWNCMLLHCHHHCYTFGTMIGSWLLCPYCPYCLLPLNIVLHLGTTAIQWPCNIVLKLFDFVPSTNQYCLQDPCYIVTPIGATYLFPFIDSLIQRAVTVGCSCYAIAIGATGSIMNLSREPREPRSVTWFRRSLVDWVARCPPPLFTLWHGAAWDRAGWISISWEIPKTTRNLRISWGKPPILIDVTIDTQRPKVMKDLNTLALIIKMYKHTSTCTLKNRCNPVYT